MIATACKDGHVRIFKLTDDSQGGALTGGWSRKMFNVTCIADFADHNAEVWRVEWNITGTILSSSGDDGKVRLWKGKQRAGAQRHNRAYEWDMMRVRVLKSLDFI